LNISERIILVVGGSGQFANVVCEAALLSGLSVVGFVTTESHSANLKLQCPRLDFAAGMQAACEGIQFVAAAGSNAHRRVGAELVARWGGGLRSVVHPAAVVSPSAVLGKGSILLAGAIVGTSANLGQSVVVNHGASIDHDCIISDFVNLSPGARLGGSVNVGAGVSIGLNASVLQGLFLSENSIVGAGAVVTRSVEGGVTVAGVPARLLE
jgi:sugar O-acyltransferase (sialic acid O-acetyltransferase NeuD family)